MPRSPLGSLVLAGALAVAPSAHSQSSGTFGSPSGGVAARTHASVQARATGSRRSVAGAALGAIVGTGVGLGVHYLLNRGSDRNIGDAIVVPIFVVSQGVFAAVGSRMLGARRGTR